MKKERKEKPKVLRVKMPVEEYSQLVAECSKSTSRSVTEYVRKRLSGSPVAVYYRNKSFDEFVNEAILLREEMEAIRTNVALSREDQERLIQLTEEIKKGINKLVDKCLERSDFTRGYHAS